MRGDGQQLQTGMFSYVALENRIPADHPLRGVRKLVDVVLAGMSKDFERLYAHGGRPSIAPEALLRAVAAGVLYSAQRAAVDGAAQLQAAVPLVRRLRDRRRDVEPGCVQQEYDRLLNQDPAQKFFAQVKATGGGADVCSNLR